MKKGLVLFFLGLFLLTGLLSIILSLQKKSPPVQSKTFRQPQVASEATSSLIPQDIENRETAKVARVIDGDTIELENGQRVRYIGIDTPETVDPRKPVQCFGQEASNKNKELVEGKTVRLEKDVSQTDKYGRLLRYVYLDNIFANDYLVKEGFAHASTFPPDVKYQQKFQESQSQAQINHKGLWSSCSQNQATQNSKETIQGCIIKGNISASREKIYHLPGQKYYDQTVIDTSRGERWFCSEEEAQKALWRKSKL